MEWSTSFTCIFYFIKLKLNHIAFYPSKVTGNELKQYQNENEKQRCYVPACYVGDRLAMQVAIFKRLLLLGRPLCTVENWKKHMSKLLPCCLTSDRKYDVSNTCPCEDQSAVKGCEV